MADTPDTMTQAVVPVLDAVLVAEVATPPVKQGRAPHRFPVGHRKFGGRKKKTALLSAVETCIKISLDPIAEMAKIYRTGVLTDPDGKKHVVDYRTRVKLLVKIAETTHGRPPVLIAGDVNHRHAHLDITHIMKYPALSEMAESLAIAMAEQESD